LANRSTFSAVLPRNIGRYVSLSQNPTPKYTKEQRQLHKGAGPEGYERALRMLMIEAHAHHKAFKLKRLAKEVAEELKSDIAEQTSLVSAT